MYKEYFFKLALKWAYLGKYWSQWYFVLINLTNFLMPQLCTNDILHISKMNPRKKQSRSSNSNSSHNIPIQYIYNNNNNSNHNNHSNSRSLLDLAKHNKQDICLDSTHSSKMVIGDSRSKVPESVFMIVTVHNRQTEAGDSFSIVWDGSSLKLLESWYPVPNKVSKTDILDLCLCFPIN